MLPLSSWCRSLVLIRHVRVVRSAYLIAIDLASIRRRYVRPYKPTVSIGNRDPPSIRGRSSSSCLVNAVRHLTLRCRRYHRPIDSLTRVWFHVHRGDHMKHFERLSRTVSLRTGIVVFAAIVVVLAVSAMAARRVGLAIVAASVVGLPSAKAAAGAEDNGTAMRPFRVAVPDEALKDLRRRIAATQWPERETVTDTTQGVQ